MIEITAENQEVGILGLLLEDNKELMADLTRGVGLTPQDFDEPYFGRVYHWIQQTYFQKQAMLPTIVAQVSNGELVLDDLEEIRDFVIGRYLRAEAMFHAQQMIKNSTRKAHIQTMQKGITRLEKGEDPLKVRRDVSKGLATVRGVVLQDASQAGISNRIDRQIEEGVVSYLTPTRLPWLDSILKGGLRSRRFIGIAGMQKGRKTTLLRNILLRVASNKNWSPNLRVSVAFLTFENDQESTYWDLVSMLGYQWMQDHGLAAETYRVNTQSGPRDFRYDRRMDGEIIQDALERNEFKDWKPQQRQAVEWARETLDQLPIWVYDSTEENGGLRTLESMATVLNRHVLENYVEGQHLIIAIDYAQLVKNGGSIYEDMRDLTEYCLAACKQTNSTIILLSQFNEATNRDRAKGLDNEYIGTKGGGDMNSSVHSYLETQRKRDFPDQLNVRMAFQRRGETGSHDFFLHPPSGMFIV